MTTNQYRYHVIERCSLRWRTGGTSNGGGGRRRGVGLAPALALAVLMLSGMPALAEPVARNFSGNAPPGTLVSVTIEAAFDSRGTNPRFTAYSFSAADANYVDDSSISRGRLWVRIKTPEQLNALANPPPARFSTVASVTMTNDENQTVTGTVTLNSSYNRIPRPVARNPSLNAPPGILFSVTIEAAFDSRGTNPRFTTYSFSAADANYVDDSSISRGRLWVRIKTPEQLNALANPPPARFSTVASVTMTNDEDQTVTGTVTLNSSYPRINRPVANHPSQNAPPGTLVSATIESAFDSRGTNPRFTTYSFSAADANYVDDSSISRGRLWVQIKTTEQLNALANPPPTPFSAVASVTMTNDENQTATGTVTFNSSYARINRPVASSTSQSAPPGTQVTTVPEHCFEYTGTNPGYTSYSLDNTDYVSSSSINDGRLFLQIKTAAELNALADPPDETFSVVATATMTNDEGQTATCTVTFNSEYTKDTQ